MTCNRSAIMTAAWASTRNLMQMLGYARHQLREVFAIELRKAWVTAKASAARIIRPAAAIRSELHMLESKSFRTNISERRTALLDELREAA